MKLGLVVTEEEYGLSWPGKSVARQQAETPPRGALAEVSGDAAGLHTFIEGDNLEVLKLLAADVAGRVKLIYLDPPYNTGNEFVYRDDYGRSHAQWLSMMLPRLLLCRELLSDDGVIVVSIGSDEVHQLALLMDEVFGEQHRLNSIVWVSNLKGRQLTGGGAVGTHEHLLVHAKDARKVPQFRGSLSALHAAMPAVYKRAGYPLKHDDRGPYVVKNELHNTNSRFNELTAPTLVFRIHRHPETGEVRVTDIDDPTRFDGFDVADPHPNSRPGLRFHAWRWSRARVLRDQAELEFVHIDGRLRIWTKVRDTDGVAIKDLVIGPSTLSAQADLDALGMGRLFETPKPVALMQLLVSAVTSGDDLVLDPFAGSCSMAHAVIVQNSLDGGRRRSISINSSEPARPGSEAAKAGHATVSQIGVERLRRVLAEHDGADQAAPSVLRHDVGAPRL